MERLGNTGLDDLISKSIMTLIVNLSSIEQRDHDTLAYLGWRYLMATINPTPPTATPEASVPPNDNEDMPLDTCPVTSSEGPDLDNSTEKTSEGEWQIVAANGKKRGKVSDDESLLKGASQSPSRHGLRRTKQRQQKEWEDFVSNLSKELQKMMGGYYASEDTERYISILPLIGVFMDTHVWYGGNSSQKNRK